MRPVSSGGMVVLADIENLTADSTLSPALRVAAVVGLQQSSTFMKQALTRALQLDTRFAMAQTMLGQYYIINNRIPGGLTWLREADKRSGRLTESNDVWGETYLSAGNVVAAESVFRRMLTRPAKADQARGHRSLAYLNLYRGRYSDAIVSLKSGIPLQPNGTLSEHRDQLLLADAAMMLGEKATVGSALDRAFAIFRTAEVEAAAVMCGHQFVRAGQLPRAKLLLDSLKARAALRPNNKQDQAALAILSGELALAEGKTDVAAKVLSATTFDPYAALELSLKAQMFARSGKRDSALVAARRAVRK